MGSAVCCQEEQKNGEVESVQALPSGSFGSFSSPSLEDSDDEKAAEGVTFTFRRLDGHLEDVIFVSTPLGVNFTAESPYYVRSVVPGLPAQEHGVKEGWVLIRVNGEEVSRDHPTAQARTRLLLSRLPARQR
eukprot:TRINITY_DN86623_c0_g1_i1.p1 TRINITY_DN86623_c0_g1~~TRINITY_DN86623_c0_g1_i1.p1  ORF type:complete len:143 (-),score=28.36 TRINITY_DN86623_c0_g1_i1:27-422(-)